MLFSNQDSQDQIVIQYVDSNGSGCPYNRPARFSFSYTFTTEDAYLGKVNFKAIAFIDRDAVTINNEAISLPVKVRR